MGFAPVPRRPCASPLTCRPFGAFSPRAVVRLAAGLALALVYVAPQQAQSTTQSSQPCAVSGLVQSGSVPLPGVAIVALGADGAEVASTSSEQNGSYVLRLAAPGTYQIRASLAAFAPSAREATLTAADCSSRIDLVLTLASRVPAASTPGPSGSSPQAGPALRQAQGRALRQAQGRAGARAGARKPPRPRAGAQGGAGSSSSTSSPTRLANRLRP